jgi:Cdc6-like AAA superfamily ATPase
VTEDVGNDEWSQAFQSLDGPNGPLYAFKVLLEQIIDEMGIKRAPKQAPQTQQSAPVVSKLRRSKLMSCFQRKSSSSSSSSAPSKRSEAFERPPNDHHRTVAIKLDTAMRDLKWPFTQPRLQELLNTLERIKTHFLVALSSDNVRLSKLIRDELQTVHGEILVIKDDTTAIREHQEGSKEWTSEQRLIFQSISTLDFSSRKSPHELEQLKRSANWLLSHSKFYQWRTGGSALLLSGMPGTGKTSICRVVEHFLQSSGPSSEVFAVAVYFSCINQPEKQSLQTVLAFIVEHMLRVRPQFQKHYNKLMLTGEGPLEVADSLRIIHRARQDFQHFYIVLDALDECGHQQAQEVVERLTSLRTPLKIFATTRDNFNSLANHFSYQITIPEEVVSVGIKTYMREALAQKLPFVITAVEFERVVETIVAQSKGMYVSKPPDNIRDLLLILHRFLLARLLLNQLCTATCQQEFNEMLELSPQTISHSYASCLQRLTEQEEGDARLGKRVLKELLSADQPTSAEELIDAVADDAGESRRLEPC